MLVSGVRSSWETVEMKESFARSSSSSRRMDSRCCSNARACIRDETRSCESPAQMASSRGSQGRGTTRLHDHPADDLVAHRDRHRGQCPHAERLEDLAAALADPSRGSSSTWSIWSGCALLGRLEQQRGQRLGQVDEGPGAGQPRHLRRRAPGALHRRSSCSASTGSTSHRSTPMARPTDSAARLTSWPDARSSVSAVCSSSTTSGWSGARAGRPGRCASPAPSRRARRRRGLRPTPPPVDGRAHVELTAQPAHLGDGIGGPGGRRNQVHDGPVCPEVRGVVQWLSPHMP